VSEYLIFNILIFIGPLILGLIPKYYFMDKWMAFLSSIVVVGLPFIIWDVLVTNSHWMFNQKYVLGYYIAGLPIEEWLFFITIPFACLYTWEMIIKRKASREISLPVFVRYFFFLLPPAGLILFLYGLQYTGLVLIFLSVGIVLDHILGIRLIYQDRFYVYIFFIVLFTLVFNGYLTWRPVVIYGEAYQIGFRIFTIPIEDFFYGISMLYMNTIIYERIKQAIFSRVKIATI
jgi:lycopene cyclase domain-containing protein